MTTRQYLTQPLTDDPAAWRGIDMIQQEAQWTVSLTDTHIAEVDAAMDGVGLTEKEIYSIQQRDFPLPTLSELLVSLRDELDGGRGFVRLRGLPAERWGEAKSRLALWGIGTHLGWAIKQDKAGSLMHDVRDSGQKFGANSTIRYYETNQAIEFHTDGADAFALFCLQKGRTGGRSLLISAVGVFNEIARQRPDLAQVLQEDFHVDARGQRTDGAKCQVIPVYSYFKNELSIILKMAYIESAQRFEDVPRLTETQIEAIAMLKRVMQDPELTMEFSLEQGDTIIASNHTILHGRTSFVDDPANQPVSLESPKRRHMLRLWLTLPNARPLPPHYADTREYAQSYSQRMESEV